MTTSNAFTSPYKIFGTAKVVLPKGKWCLVYDAKLKSKISKLKGDIPFRIPLKGGDQTKSFRELEKFLAKLSQLEAKHGNVDGICVMGGGSLGDAVSFAASIYRRGIRLVQIPTTYLSVIDSAFGGKTAVNFAGAKNQVGSYYPAEAVLIQKSLLPKDSCLLKDSFAEILKMAILESALWKKLNRVKKADLKNFWMLAPAVINAKLRIVEKDPREKLGIRNLLNLGHSFGHLFERLAPLSHGEAVALGLYYELEVFYLAGKISEDNYLDILDVWERFFDFKRLNSKLGRNHSLKVARALLSKDKKSQGTFVKTPVVYKAGKVKVEKLSREALLRFLQLQGILR